MSSLRKIPYTKPLPAGVEPFARRGVHMVRWTDGRGRRREAELTEDGTRIRLYTREWWGEYTDADGIVQCVRLARDRTAAEQMLAELVRKAERAKVGIRDDYEEHRLRPLAEHLADFEQELRTAVRRGRKRPPTAKQVAIKVGRIRRVLDGCGFRLSADLSLARVQEFLADLSAGAASRLTLDVDAQWFTLAELAQLLGVKPASVNPLVRRHGLGAEGNGKARRYPRATVEALLARQERGAAVSTAGYYAREIKAFTRWLARRRRIPDDPLADLPGATLLSGHRHDRRPLSEGELRRLLDAARGSDRTYRGLTGRDRRTLYLTAAITGYRASELAALRPADFDLDAAPPSVTLTGERTKNGQTAEQPLPSDAAEALRDYLSGRPADAFVWPGTWPDRAAEMLRYDLDAAGIAPVSEGPDGLLFVDFHSLRHSFVSLLDATGATLKQAMHLARHSDPRLTMARYGRPRIHDLGAVAERLPNLLAGAGPERQTDAQSQPLRATGTDGPTKTPCLDSLRRACATDELRCGSLTTDEQTTMGDTSGGRKEKPLVLQGVEGDCDGLKTPETSSGGWDRTSDTRLMKPSASVSNPLSVNTSGESPPRLAPVLAPSPSDPELTRLVAAWPMLPGNIRAATMALLGAAPSSDFAARFTEAFDRLDRQHGSHNHLSLLWLRRELADIPRDVFEAELRRLRQLGRFSLSAAEGRHGLTAEERDAAIREFGELLLFVSRREE